MIRFFLLFCFCGCCFLIEATTSSTEDSSLFETLSCNSEISTCRPWSQAVGPAVSRPRRIIIPCGTCVYVDVPELHLHGGLDIRGRLVHYAATKNLKLTTSMIVVQGFWQVQAGASLQVDLINDDDNNSYYFDPIHNNRNKCGGGPCFVGPRSITVAGGQVDCKYIHCLYEYLLGKEMKLL